MSQIITDISMPISGYANTLARNLIARLELHYPSFTGFWRVTVNEPGGVIEVTNLMLSGRYGFLMHINKIDPGGRKVIRAAGELLERYRLSRSKICTFDSVFSLPTDFRGEPVFDNG